MRNTEVNPIDFEPAQSTQRKILHVELYCFVRLTVALVCFIAGLFFPAGGMTRMVFMLFCFLLAAYDVVMKSVEDIMLRHELTMEPLIMLASLSAFAVGLEGDGAALMLLYRVCGLVLDYAVERTEGILQEAIDKRPALVIVSDGSIEAEMERDAVHRGDTILLKSGMVSALDCIVLQGRASILCPWECKELLRQDVQDGDFIPAGATIEAGELSAEVVTVASDSKIVKLWEESQRTDLEKSTIQHWAELYKRFFAPVALALGAVVTVLLNVIGHCSVSNAVHRALCLVILMNPAGLLAAISAAYHVGRAGAISRGILFRGNKSIDTMAKSVAVMLEKDGVLTTGEYQVERVVGEKLPSDLLLKAAAHAAANANSPTANAVVTAYGDKIDYSLLSNFVEYPDGLSVEIEGISVLMGTKAFLSQRGITIERESGNGLFLHVVFAGEYAGSILLSEAVRENIGEAVEQLQALGCSDVVLLSEESSEKTHRLARLCGLDNYYANCGREEKLSRISETCQRSYKASALYVSADVEKDMEYLSSASLGVVLGEPSANAEDETGVLLFNKDLRVLPEAISRAQMIKQVLLQSMAIIGGVKLVLILLAISGVSSLLWFDVFVDGCVGVVAVLNAIRAFPIQK